MQERHTVHWFGSVKGPTLSLANGRISQMNKDSVGADVNQVQIDSLAHIKGQPRVVDNLEVHLRAYFNIKSVSGNSGVSFGPVFLCGPSGTGKTLVAKAIHAELGNLRLIDTNGVTASSKRELCSILINADENTTVFLDEAQGMNAKAQHILLTALSERKLYVPAGTTSMCSCTLQLANFTTILATTHEYLLKSALRNRMRIYCRFDYYSVEDLVEIVRQRANALNWQYESDQALQIIARRAKKTPRLALHRNLQTCWNVTRSHNRSVITVEDVLEAFYHLQIDESGLDQLDRSYLEILLQCGETPLGVLSSKLSLPTLTIQRIVEPYLLKEGYVTKDRHSLRVITEKGREHIESSALPSKHRKLEARNVTG
jgi:Holliday junction resolvasome RuvABC ATP-dependent DNA helicase subunit